MSTPPTFGKYELKSQLGKGSSGTVYLATDTFTCKDVALKVLDSRLLDSPDRRKYFQNQFLNEASLVGKLSHPHIVSILDASVGDNYGYIAMEYVAGGNLRALAEAENLAPVEKVIEIGFKCCGALDYAHRKGIIHRDIKPANIMVVKDTDIKVTDFGAALLRNTDRTQILDIGSPAYMSPEQVRGDALTYQSDMFSLGTVLYHLLSGAKPFNGKVGLDLQNKILQEQPLPLSYLRPELPPELDIVLLSALAKNPRDRYPSWADFALGAGQDRPALPLRAVDPRQQQVRLPARDADAEGVYRSGNLGTRELHQLDAAAGAQRDRDGRPAGTEPVLPRAWRSQGDQGRTPVEHRAQRRVFRRNGLHQGRRNAAQATVEAMTEVVVAELGAKEAAPVSATSPSQT